MDQRHFDHLIRDFSTTTTRRGSFRVIVAIVLGTMFGWLPSSRGASAATDCCPAERPRRCGYTCVNLKTDHDNCGACGHECGWGSICRHGVCDQAADFTKTAIVVSSQTPTRTHTKTRTPTKTPTRTPTKTHTPTKMPTPATTSPPFDMCADHVKNGYETDVDCGGPVCPKCESGFSCQSAADCLSGICNGGFCQKPSCYDFVKNGNESDVDCGGDSCQKCEPGQNCNVDADCASGLCDAGLCTKQSCTDGIKNGDETDTDCGGSCASCSNGKNCRTAADCHSGVCDPSSNLCVDCLMAANCAGVDNDCQSRVCNNYTCGMSFAPAGQPVLQQTPGDCQKSVCDGAGNMISVDDITDVPANGPCCVGICDSGQPSYKYLASTYLCSNDPTTYCSGTSCLCQ